jgi:hypothetical protein
MPHRCSGRVQFSAAATDTVPLGLPAGVDRAEVLRRTAMAMAMGAE